MPRVSAPPVEALPITCFITTDTVTATRHMMKRAIFLIGTLAGMVFTYLLCADNVMAQSAVPIAGVQGMVTHETASMLSRFLLDETSHVLVGVLAALAGVFAHRAWSRRRWRSAPTGVVIESVLTVDLVNSTFLATHHGEDRAMRARMVLERRALAAGKSKGVTFVENTGDGCMMTFPSVFAAAQAAGKLLRGLRDRPPELAPSPLLEVRAAVTFGQILLDARGSHHGATINEAFRLIDMDQYRRG